MVSHEQVPLQDLIGYWQQLWQHSREQFHGSLATSFQNHYQTCLNAFEKQNETVLHLFNTMITVLPHRLLALVPLVETKAPEPKQPESQKQELVPVVPSTPFRQWVAPEVNFKSCPPRIYSNAGETILCQNKFSLLTTEEEDEEPVRNGDDVQDIPLPLERYKGQRKQQPVIPTTVAGNGQPVKQPSTAAKTKHRNALRRKKSHQTHEVTRDFLHLVGLHSCVIPLYHTIQHLNHSFCDGFKTWKQRNTSRDQWNFKPLADRFTDWKMRFSQQQSLLVRGNSLDQFEEQKEMLVECARLFYEIKIKWLDSNPFQELKQQNLSMSRQLELKMLPTMVNFWIYGCLNLNQEITLFLKPKLNQMNTFLQRRKRSFIDFTTELCNKNQCGRQGDPCCNTICSSGIRSRVQSVFLTLNLNKMMFPQQETLVRNMWGACMKHHEKYVSV